MFLNLNFWRNAMCNHPYWGWRKKAAKVAGEWGDRSLTETKMKLHCLMWKTEEYSWLYLSVQWESECQGKRKVWAVSWFENLSKQTQKQPYAEWLWAQSVWSHCALSLALLQCMFRHCPRSPACLSHLVPSSLQLPAVAEEECSLQPARLPLQLGELSLKAVVLLFQSKFKEF